MDIVWLIASASKIMIPFLVLYVFFEIEEYKEIDSLSKSPVEVTIKTFKWNPFPLKWDMPDIKPV